MGIKGFGNILKMCNVPHRTINGSSISGHVIAIDMMNRLYAQWCNITCRMRGKGNYSKAIAAEVLRTQGIQLVDAVLNEIYKITSCGAFAIVVFDGPIRDEKHSEVERRHNTSTNVPLLIDAHFMELLTNELNNNNIMYIIAQHDAEELCAKMDRCGIIDGTWTKDYDYFPFGGRTMITDIKRRGSNVTLSYYSSIDIHRLILDRYDMFVSMCITLGCDFINRQRGYGPVTAYKWHTSGKSILDIPDVDIIAVTNVANIFMQPIDYGVMSNISATMYQYYGIQRSAVY